MSRMVKDCQCVKDSQGWSGVKVSIKVVSIVFYETYGKNNFKTSVPVDVLNGPHWSEKSTPNEMNFDFETSKSLARQNILP